MRQQLSITHEITIDDMKGMADMLEFAAETDWAPETSKVFPLHVTGELLDLPAEAIEILHDAVGAVVFFKGRRYNFETLNHDGNFVLHRDW